MDDHADHEHADHDHQHTHQDQAEPPDYESWVAAQRTGKDDYFKRSARSPLPHEQLHAFTGLNYFPVDTAMRFEFLNLGPVPEGLEVSTQVQTSDGAVRDGKRVGTLKFSIDGAEQEVVGLRLAGAEDGSLFVPFKDATNGPESYGAGRYLDLAAQEDGTYDLDFNLAYAPFCAYSPSYSCPLPPSENWLSVRIEAGERNL
jgi:uncharacterized protein (DUF1684 family)